MNELNEQEQERTDYTWMIIAGTIYVGLLIYFGWQTWQFVDWLFPSEQLGMKCLSLLSFDIMAFLWACIDLFDRKKNEPASRLVRWAWGISFALSLIASVLYLVISNMLRFSVPITEGAIDTGEAVTIVALTLNILFLTFWMYGKFERQQGRPRKVKRLAPSVVTQAPATFAQTAPLPEPAAPQLTQPAGSAEGVCFYCEETKPAGRMTLRRDPAEGLVPICWDCVQRISAPVRVVKPGGGSASPLPLDSAQQNGHKPTK